MERAVKIGVVTTVEGSRVLGITRAPEGGALAATAPEYGALVKMRCPDSLVYGLVSKVWMNLPQVTMMLEVELLGEIVGRPGSNAGRFQRGVSVHPRIGTEILATDAEDVASVYANGRGADVRIGTLHQDPSRPVHIHVDNLLGKHFAILGTTGAGKSCATALILRSVLDSFPNGHVVMLDPHNEYARAFAERAEVLDPTTVRLPYWMLNFAETASIFCSQDVATREYELAILKEAILKARREFAATQSGRANVGHITVDTPSPYLLADVLATVEKGLGRLEKVGGALPYLRLQSRIEAMRADDRFGFMFSRDFVDDTLAEIVSRLIRVPVDGKPITIIDLSGVPSEIVDVLVSVMCRMIFDFALWSVEHHAAPTLLVCEEAHRYVPRDERLGFEPTRRAITRIAMEGRKHGVSLCLVSNRPSELSATMLAQCNTIFALRMSNQQDQEFVRSVLPEGTNGLLAALPALRPQEAVAIGDGVSIPLRLRFDDLDDAHRPRSTTAPFAHAWKRQALGQDFVRDTITRWRHQRRAGANGNGGAGRASFLR